jgi:fatty acid desaturase
MADLIQLPGTGAQAKLRSPLAVVLFTIITLGIYTIFWWYFINREMVDLGRARGIPDLGEEPAWSVVAATVGALVIIPPFVTLWRTCRRIERAQNHVLGTNNFSPILAFILALIPIVQFVVPFLMQSNLNQVWRRVG